MEHLECAALQMKTVCNSMEARPIVPESTAPQTPAAPQRHDSRALLGATGEALIRHAGQDYRLRQTRQGKLILTK